MRHIQLYTLVDRRQRRKLSAAQSLRRRLARFGLGCGAFLLLSLVLLIAGLGASYTGLVRDLPSPGLLPEMLDPEDGLLMQPTRLYDRSGQHLLLSLENPGVARRYLTLDPKQPEHFSPELVRATVGALDPGFWKSPGVSLRRLTYPLPVTIAERLVDDLLLSQEPRGLRRTLRMRLLAAQVTARYGHVRVLEWYLNSASYGHLAYGAGSAARLYLDKPAASLTLAEAALLVAANRAPALNPLDAPAAAVERQRAVLDLLLANGAIPEAEYRRALDAPLNIASPPGVDASPAAAFSRLVIDRLSERLGRERLERGGLRIITTLDYSLQLEVACLARAQLSRLAGQPEEARLPDGSPCQSARLLPTLLIQQPLPRGLTTSAVVIDPQTGQVLALLGDTSLTGESDVISAREPGSLLAPFAAVASFARGMGPATLVWDIPSALTGGSENTTASNGEGAAAITANPDGQFRGPVRLRMALANDYLVPQARMVEQIGAQNVWQLAGAFGLHGLADERSAGPLVQGGLVSPLELAQAYGVLASQGVRTGQRMTASGELRPAVVLYVEDADGVLWFDGSQPEAQTIVSAQLAYLVHHVLADATARRPSLGYPNALEIGRPAGAKVGQVQGQKLAWTAGYTPQRVVVFSLNLPGESGSAQVSPPMVAGMWHALMQYAGRDMPAVDWPQPQGITRLEICDPSGQLPTEACPEIASEIFLNGSEPTGPDTLYRVFSINRETGRLATVFTPASLVEEKIYLVVPPQARDWAEAAELPVPPQDYDAIQPPAQSPTARIDTPQLYAFVRGQVRIQGTAAGDRFRFYQVQAGQGINPLTWLQVGQEGAQPLEDGELAVWDTTGLNGLFSLRLLVVRDDQTAETAAIQVTVDNTAPLVRVPYPLNGQSFAYPAERAVTFQADVEDALGVRRLDWLVDGKEIGQTLQPPYAFTWQSTRGEHVLQVRAVDQAGNEGLSEEVRFTVQ